MTPLPRYPVYVISKGRHDRCLTSKFLRRDGVPHHVVVEPQEADLYAGTVGADRLLVLPFSNLGQGSIPARNWLWEHSISGGHARHWCLDDNIRDTWRRFGMRKIRCQSNFAFACAERFVERYENIGIIGLNYYMFAPCNRKMAPFYHNVHVYSFMCIDNSLPFRWRGRYNEDTDLCLQVLSSGLCTVLLNAFLAYKIPTMMMKGGNTDQLYAGDGRLKMAKSLERMWPGVVTVVRKFRRPQHSVKWGKFTTPLKLRPGSAPASGIDEMGMDLKMLKQPKNPKVARLYDRYHEGRAKCRAASFS
jgi:hypothetical protein